MPPVNFSLVREARSESFTTVLDLSLITATLTVSLVLAVTPRSKSLSYNHKPFWTLFVIITSFVATSAAIVLFVVALWLGWRRTISPHALSGVVFALATVLLRLPCDNLYYALLVSYVSRRRSLWVEPQHFRYIRIGNACKSWKSDDVDKKWKSDFGGNCKFDKCEVKMFIRCLPVRKHYPLVQWFIKPKFEFGNGEQDEQSPDGFQHVNDDQSVATTRSSSMHSSSQYSQNELDECTPLLGNDAQGVIQWYGLRVGHTKNYVMLRDVDDGLTAWWFSKVSSATHLIDSYLKCDVKNSSRMLNALALIADIIAICDLVFYVRREYLEYLWDKDMEIINSKTSTPGIMCCKLVKELGLDSWVKHRHDMKEIKFETYKRHSNGILLAILAERSRMFGDWCPSHDGSARTSSDTLPALGGKCGFTDWCPCLKYISKKQRISAQQVLDAVMKANSTEFKKACEGQVDEWLVQWGCTRESIDNFYQPKLAKMLSEDTRDLRKVYTAPAPSRKEVDKAMQTRVQGENFAHQRAQRGIRASEQATANGCLQDVKNW